MFIETSNFKNSEQQLKLCDYWNCNLDDLLDEFKDYSKLTYLNCCGCELTKLPNKISKYINLSYLNLNMNEIKDLSNIKKLINLEELHINSNILTILPKEIFQIKNLKFLSCKYNKLKELSKEIKNLKNLNLLLCNFNKLLEIPKEIGSLTNLLIFNCSNNFNIKNLPNEIGNLKNLQELYINNMKLTILPETIGNLKNLTKLCCIFNNLESIPSSIINLENLIELNLTKNNLIEIPDLKKLKNLRKLGISHNKLYKLPINIGELINLELLECGVNNLTTIPRSIKKLKKLEILELNNNKILFLPREIGELIKLKNLKICYNNLIEFPKEINKWTNLEILKCNNNNLTIFPNIYNNVNLNFLDIKNNSIKSLPAEISMCYKLNDFLFSNNPIEYIPPNINRFISRKKYKQYIYNDKQSVHNNNIQKCIRESVNNLLNDGFHNFTIEKIINDNILKKNIKEQIIEYCNDINIHSTLGLTFKELLSYVWYRIEYHQDKDVIKSILNSEMNDALCQCFTGRMSRLVNCLNGFYNDIVINISTNEQISNIIIINKNDNIEIWKENVKKELEERNYDNKIIQEWLFYIC